jgi:hypothetical protein
MQRNLTVVLRSLAATRILTIGFGAIELLAPLAGLGQMHKVAKPEDVVRAVGVYEWIGDRTKPTATRLIPVSLFIDGSFQDAGVYLARPVPFALDGGTVYEIDKAGVPEGTVDLISARHLQAVGDAPSFDDGWVAYGKFVPPQAAKKKTVALKQTKPTATITSDVPDKDSDRPTFSRRIDHTDAGSTSKSSTTDTASAQPPDDPDRPHLSKKPDPSATDGSGEKPAASDTTADKTASPSPGPATDTTGDKSSTGSSTTTSSADPDRPTLRRRSPEEAKKARREAEQSSASGLATSLNDDPNRPTLHRGRGEQELTDADLPKLKGVPADLHQAVAVSDAHNRPLHDFSRPWVDDAERTTVLAKMQAMAQAQIAAYRASQAPAPAKPATRTPNSKLRHARTPESVQTPATPLFDEQLSGYTLSYGGAATYVYSARTGGEGESLVYVTIVAQRDTFGELKPAIQNVTDAAHLDRTPWMRLVDVVDADASNRASLLFEMRDQTARQFALYRVIAARPEQIFLTGTTQ